MCKADAAPDHYLQFLKEGKRDTIIEGTEGFDFLAGAGFLIAKLVAGKTENQKSLVFVFLNSASKPAYCGV